MSRKLIVAIIGFLVCLTGTCAAAGKERSLAAKKVLMVIAPRDFRDEELSLPRSLLEKKGAKITLASTTAQEIKGMLGAKVTADALLKDVRASDYDAIVFIGGSGAQALFDNADAHRLARDGVNHGKIVAAICIAPCILAKAGVLKDRKATVFPGRQFVKILKRSGARVVDKALVEDGRLVTANGPNAAARFGDAIVRALAVPFKDDPPP